MSLPSTCAADCGRGDTWSVHGTLLWQTRPHLSRGIWQVGNPPPPALLSVFQLTRSRVCIMDRCGPSTRVCLSFPRLVSVTIKTNLCCTTSPLLSPAPSTLTPTVFSFSSTRLLAGHGMRTARHHHHHSLTNVHASPAPPRPVQPFLEPSYPSSVPTWSWQSFINLHTPYSSTYPPTLLTVPTEPSTCQSTPRSTPPPVLSVIANSLRIHTIKTRQTSSICKKS